MLTSELCASTSGSAFWGKGATINVCWENPRNGDYMMVVKEAVRSTWEANSSVRFVGWDNCAPGMPGIHIIIADVNPASAVGMAALNGVTASLKDDPAGGPLQVLDDGMALNFDFVRWPVAPACTVDADCGATGLQCLDNICTTFDRPKSWFVKVIAIHEFGHALGFFHEQAKVKTPAWCTERDIEGDAISCDAFVDDRWDASSVMNYCNPAWGGDGNLSHTDIKWLRHFYDGPPPCAQPGLDACDGACVDLQTDVADCGSCGMTCADDQVCVGGSCMCEAPLVWCGDRCVRLGTRDHCGKCGDDCELGTSCRSGACADCRECSCPDGFIAGPLSCENTPTCRKICMAHEQGSGHIHD